MANYYVSSVKHAAVAQFAISTAYTQGQIVRQLAAPAVGSERCFRCSTAGTSGGSESAWNLTQNATTNQGTAVFTECTGQETYQGTTWAAPFARLGTAVSSSFSTTGDTIYVASDHAETQTSALTITSAGTAASMQRVLCVTVTSNALPPASGDLTTGGSVTVTTGNGLALEGSFYCYGLLFHANGGASPADITLGSISTTHQIFDHCTFRLTNTAAGTSRINLGVASGPVGVTTEWWNTTFDNLCTVSSGTTIRSRGGTFKWYGGSLTSNGLTSLLTGSGTTQAAGPVELVGLDLSILSTSQKVLTQDGAGSSGQVTYNISNCKFISSYPAGMVMSGTIQADGWGDVDMITSNNTGHGSREEHYRFQGSIVGDVSNYRNGGASDGVDSKSWKMVSLSNASYQNSLFAPDIYTWLPSAGSYTLTMFVANTSSLTLTNAEFGFDYFWMGTSGNPLATISTTMGNVIASGSALTTDGTSTWTGLASPVKQKVAVTFTTTEPGFVRIRPRLARASTTVYVDPLVVVS